MQTLTPKQQRFVEEYQIDFNATQAAIRAGYSKRTAKQIATENLSKPVISKAIKVKQSELSERTGFTLDKLDAELMSLYRRCRSDGNYSVAERCLEMMGKRLGAFTDKLQTDQVDYVDLLVEAQPLIEIEKEKRRNQEKDK